MKDIFPEPITNLPEADMPLKGVRAYLSQADRHQVIFMQFDCDDEMAEHAHSRTGWIRPGRENRSRHRRDPAHVPEGRPVLYPRRGQTFRKIYAGYAQVAFFGAPDRYTAKK